MRPALFPNITNGTLQATTDLITAEVRRTPSVVDTVALTAGVAANVAVPAGAEWALFNACNLAGTAQIPFFVCDAAVATASLPSGTNAAGTASEFMPIQYNVRQQRTVGLSAISPSSGYLVVTFYADPQSTANT